MEDSVCAGSGREELAEGSSHLSDHVGSGCGTPVLLEGQMVTLPCECARTPGSHQEWAGAVGFLWSSTEGPVCHDTQGA